VDEVNKSKNIGFRFVPGEAGKAQNCLQTIRHYLQTVKNIVSFIGLYQAFSGKCLVKSGDTGEIIVTSSSRSHHKQLQSN
jgi:hypothetical protein